MEIQNERGRAYINRLSNKITEEDITEEEKMTLGSDTVECVVCTQLITNQSYECSHCLMPFCYQCLAQHHQTNVKHEFITMLHRIDEIQAKFLHHAHNQTEWTNHLAIDRDRLECYIQHIENSHRQHPILHLPDYRWISHVHSLIYKTSFAIYEDCLKLMYPSVNLSMQSSTNEIKSCQ